MTPSIEDIRHRFSLIAGPINSVPPDSVNFEQRSTRDVPGARITELRYRADRAAEVPALLLAPLNESPRRLAVALHQTTKPMTIGKEEPAGLGGRENFHYGLDLARRGYAVVCPDYPGFGTYTLDETEIYDNLGYLSVTAKGIRNHIVAVSLLAQLFPAAPDDILAIGHSMGGSNAIFLALHDLRIRVICCSAGFSTFASYAAASSQGDLTGWAKRDKYMPLIFDEFGADPSLIPVDFGEMLACLAPRRLFCSMPRRDNVFDFAGALHAAREAKDAYKYLGCSEQMCVATPEVGHDFPDDVRKAAYEYLAISKD